MKPSYIPEEHPTFHRNTMIGAFVMIALVGAFAYIGNLSHNQGKDWNVSDMLFLCPFVSLIIWFIYRAHWAKPHCPKCKNIKPTYKGKESEGYKQRWRIFKCDECEHVFCVPECGSD